jgi:pimeloyl-ACP methyl ester carboxylesterase
VFDIQMRLPPPQIRAEAETDLHRPFLCRHVLAGILLCCSLPFIAVPCKADAAPEVFLAFPFQFTRSGERTAGLVNVRHGRPDGLVDLYAVVEAPFAEGESAVRYADPAGTLTEALVPCRTNHQLSPQPIPIKLTQPVISWGRAHQVTWSLVAIPAGRTPGSFEELAAINLARAVPRKVTVTSAPCSHPWERFALLQAMGITGGIHFFAEVLDEGRSFNGYAGDDAPQRLWQLPGPKLVLIAGLGCSGRAWMGDHQQFIVDGRMPPWHQGLLTYEPLLRNYRWVAFFDYPSAGALDGPAILGRLCEAMHGASPEDRIDLIGHSMGGMVARCFIELGGGHRVVDNAVFLQTPLNGVHNRLHQRLSALAPAATVDVVLNNLSPLARLLRGSELLKKLNEPWRRGDPPVSPTGFAGCRYFSVAAGIFGSGRDPHSTAGWYDFQSDAFPTEIAAANALWLPLGGGGLGELDPTGAHEVLLVSASPEQDAYLRHASFVFHMADDGNNGAGSWLTERLWPRP